METDYEKLDNKPSINGVELTSDMELADIGILEMTPDMIAEIFLETFGYIQWYPYGDWDFSLLYTFKLYKY